MDSRVQCVKCMGPQLSNPKRYKKLEEDLIYLTNCTWLDISTPLVYRLDTTKTRVNHTGLPVFVCYSEAERKKKG